MKKTIYPTIVFILITTFCLLCGAQAQNIGINPTGATANASALLDLDATGGPAMGLLVPRIALTAINLAAPVTSPATSLLIYNTATANTGTLAVSPGYYYWDGTQWVRFQYVAAGTSSLDWSLTGNAGTVASTNFIGTTDAVDWIVKTNNVERMRVLSGGNVGIGTTSPARVFEVRNPALNPQLQVGTTSLLSNRGSILFGRSALWEVGSDISVNNSDNFFIAQASSGQYALTIDNNRNVGIGTVTPANKLHIVVTATNTGFQLQDGSEGLNKTLTSDATGKASWQTPPSSISVSGIFSQPINTNIPVTPWWDLGSVSVPSSGVWSVTYNCRLQHPTFIDGSNAWHIAVLNTNAIPSSTNLLSLESVMGVSSAGAAYGDATRTVIISVTTPGTIYIKVNTQNTSQVHDLGVNYSYGVNSNYIVARKLSN